jgi:hypothetical protein
MKAGALRTPCRNGDEIKRAASLSVKVTDRILRARPTDIVSSAGARRMNAAVPIRSNLLRLEHRLQTVVNGGADAAAISLRADGTRRPLRLRTSPPARAPHDEFRLPCSFKGIGGSLFRPHRWRRWRRRDRTTGSKPASAYGSAIGWGTIAADVPDALTGHNRNISPSATLFIRPQPRNWQAAYGGCPNGGRRRGADQ